MGRIKRVLLAHFFEHEYFMESIGKYVIAVVFIISLVFLSNWVDAVRIYRTMPSYYGFYVLGLSILATALALLMLVVALLIPRFEETLAPRGFKHTLAKGREKHIMVAVVLAITTLVALVVFLGYYTEAFLKIG